MDVFSQSEQAQTLTEIAKIDPSFNKENFLKECEFEIIPTVLEVGLLFQNDFFFTKLHYFASD